MFELFRKIWQIRVSRNMTAIDSFRYLPEAKGRLLMSLYDATKCIKARAMLPCCSFHPFFFDSLFLNLGGSRVVHRTNQATHKLWVHAHSFQCPRRLISAEAPSYKGRKKRQKDFKRSLRLVSGPTWPHMHRRGAVVRCARIRRPFSSARMLRTKIDLATSTPSPPPLQAEAAHRITTDTSTRHAVLIDVNPLIYRSFYSHPVMTRPDGTHVNAVYGYTRCGRNFLYITIVVLIGIVQC